MDREIAVETLSLPTPYAVGPVNAYLLDGDPLTLIDAGVNTVDAENALRLGFAAKGIFLESVERILITHGHPDHYGLVPTIRDASQAEAFMGLAEIERLSNEATEFEIGRLLVEAGFPTDLLGDLAERQRKLLKVHAATKLECSPVSDGDLFEFRDFLLIAISLPGHTGGHLGYLERGRGTMFSGDTLLPHISPNPLLEPEGDSPARRRPSLKQYLESLDKLESLDLNVVYPGHGPAITDPPTTIKYMRDHHSRRLDVVHERLDWDGKTPYLISTELYPHVNGYDHFLAVSEVLAHLDVLSQQERAVSERRDDGIEYFVRL